MFSFLLSLEGQLRWFAVWAAQMTALRVQCHCSQLQRVGTGGSMCVSGDEGVPFWVTLPLAAGAVPEGRVVVTGSHSLVFLRGRCKGVT